SRASHRRRQSVRQSLHAFGRCGHIGGTAGVVPAQRARRSRRSRHRAGLAPAHRGFHCRGRSARRGGGHDGGHLQWYATAWRKPGRSDDAGSRSAAREQGQDMTKLRLAIVGFGKIATTRHVPAIAASADVELVAIADPKATALDVPNFPSLERLLKDGPAIDAVTLCTPPQVRSAQALLALEAGKHVMLEKPP